MIGYLSGKPRITPYSCYLLVQGVGYTILCTDTTKAHLASLEDVEVYVYSHIKEDCLDLYAFLSESEKQLFLKLLDVDGIGPKTALAIMDRGTDAIIHAVQQADVSFFSSIPRVGKKSAQKIIIELKTKLGGGEELDLMGVSGKTQEVVDALVSLGFQETESMKIAKTFDLELTRIEDAVKESIRMLTKK